jgi:hypothetical protein
MQNVVMLDVIMLSVVCSECHYIECRYAVCCCAPKVLINGSILAIAKQEEVTTPKITVSLKDLNE